MEPFESVRDAKVKIRFYALFDFRDYVTTTDHENVYLQYGIIWRFSDQPSDVLLHPIGRGFEYTHLTYNLRKFFPIFGEPKLPKNATFTGKDAFLNMHDKIAIVQSVLYSLFPSAILIIIHLWRCRHVTANDQEQSSMQVELLLLIRSFVCKYESSL